MDRWFELQLQDIDARIGTPRATFAPGGRRQTLQQCLDPLNIQECARSAFERRREQEPGGGARIGMQ
jgi:hypothetical protein